MPQEHVFSPWLFEVRMCFPRGCIFLLMPRINIPRRVKDLKGNTKPVGEWGARAFVLVCLSVSIVGGQG